MSSILFMSWTVFDVMRMREYKLCRRLEVIVFHFERTHFAVLHFERTHFAALNLYAMNILSLNH